MQKIFAFLNKIFFILLLFMPAYKFLDSWNKQNSYTCDKFWSFFFFRYVIQKCQNYVLFYSICYSFPKCPCDRFFSDKCDSVFLILASTCISYKNSNWKFFSRIDKFRRKMLLIILWKFWINFLKVKTVLSISCKYLRR